MTSVNTNTGAMTALMSLNQTSSSLATTEKMISTGYKVNDAMDDGAAYAVAQNIRGNVNVLTAVNNQLGNTSGLMSVTNSAMNSSTTLMTKMAGDLANLADAPTDSQKAAYQTTFAQDIQQLSSYLNGANYNGVSLVDKTSVSLTAAADGHTDISIAAATVAGPSASVVIADEQGTSYTISAFAQQAGTTPAATSVTSTGGFSSANDLITQLVNIASAQDPSAAAKAALGTSAVTGATGYSTLSQLSTQLNAQANTFAAQATYVTNQETYNSSKMDALNTGLGSLVDADLAKESANLTALQIKQQLGQQSLSIANQAPSGLASLFR